MKTLGLVVLAFLAGSPVFAQVQANKAADAKRLCRREVPTGSIMPGKLICLTRAEWQAVGDTRDQATDSFRHRPLQNIDLKTAGS